MKTNEIKSLQNQKKIKMSKDLNFLANPLLRDLRVN